MARPFARDGAQKWRSPAGTILELFLWLVALQVIEVYVVSVPSAVVTPPAANVCRPVVNMVCNADSFKFLL
jgi:hypothetical protein